MCVCLFSDCAILSRLFDRTLHCCGECEFVSFLRRQPICHCKQQATQLPLGFRAQAPRKVSPENREQKSEIRKQKTNLGKSSCFVSARSACLAAPRLFVGAINANAVTTTCAISSTKAELEPKRNSQLNSQSRQKAFTCN